MNYKYKISLIIPVYNTSAYLRNCLDSVVMQTIDKSEIEVLLINDGSKDNSLNILNEYSAKYHYMTVFSKKNEGQSIARNYGIQRAQGKYLMYLDSDDAISANTMQTVSAFFDQHYDEVDLVTYDEIPVIDGEVTVPLDRYQCYTSTGVYDLQDFRYAFVLQTNMNICVKNLGQENILFDTNRLFRQEDQKYCTQQLQKKLKIGYCADAVYYYLRRPESTVHTYFYAYYIFESSMRFWEELFNSYGDKHIPYYIQSLYLNDINWKYQSDILLPYHYSDPDLVKAKERVLNLLDKIDDKVILHHPALDRFQRHFFITHKRNNDIKVIFKDNKILVTNHGSAIIKNGKFRIMINDIRLIDKQLSITGILESTVLDYIDKPRLFINQLSADSAKTEILLRFSGYSYHKSKNITAKKYLVQYDIDISKISSFYFTVETNNKEYKCLYRFNNNAPFSKTLNSIIRGKYKITYNDSVITVNPISPIEETASLAPLKLQYIISDHSLWSIRNEALRQKKNRIWLYYDCKGVYKDNGFYQFEYDIKKNDGVDRYYVINEENFTEESHKYPEAVQARIIQFGSARHKILFLAAEKVITAFIERSNYNPFEIEDYKQNLDLFDLPRLYYLQHGVLHAHAPWKYSSDKLFIRKEVISTRFEEDNLKNNYCFTDEQLAKTGMPRYDFIDANKKKGRKILFAPSWRQYLIGHDSSGWVGKENVFRQSDFFKASFDFLSSKKLQQILEENDTTLDFKLHPIFEQYKHCYDIHNSRVCISGKKVDETDYGLFITDFSSYSFDFAYLKTPIIYFVPDYDMFKAGMNYYRELDLPLEDGLGPLTQTTDDLLNTIEELLSGDSKEEYIKYKKRVDNLFFYNDNSQRDRIYQVISND